MFYHHSWSSRSSLTLTTSSWSFEILAVCLVCSGSIDEPMNVRWVLLYTLFFWIIIISIIKIIIVTIIFMLIMDHDQFPRSLTSSNFQLSANECLMSPLLGFPYCSTHFWSGGRWSWSWSSWWSLSSQWSWWSFSFFILQSVFDIAELSFYQDLNDPR